VGERQPGLKRHTLKQAEHLPRKGKANHMTAAQSREDRRKRAKQLSNGGGQEVAQAKWDSAGVQSRAGEQVCPKKENSTKHNETSGYDWWKAQWELNDTVTLRRADQSVTQSNKARYIFPQEGGIDRRLTRGGGQVHLEGAAAGIPMP